MSQVCGKCARYRKMPFCEDICILSGKIVPYLAQRECFMTKVEQDTNLLNQDTNLLNQDTNKMTENANIKTKVCKDCGRELPIDEFQRQTKSKDGYMHICRECKQKRVNVSISKKVNEAFLKTFGKEEVKQADKGFPVTQDKYDRLQEYTAQELVDHLRFQGWEVTCTKTIKL